MCCLNCQSASDRTTYRISLEFNLNSKWDVWHQCHRSTWLERLLSPSGSELSLCQNAYQPKTVVKAREQLRAANFLSLPRPFLYASVSFFFFPLQLLLLLLPLSFSSFLLFSPPSILLTTCPASAEIECEVSHFCHRDKGSGVERGLCTCDWSPRARDLWGLRACWTSHFPHQSPCRRTEVGSICWVSVRLPSQPTQGPLTMPQVHGECKPNGTHLVFDRWTFLV